MSRLLDSLSAAQQKRTAGLPPADVATKKRSNDAGSERGYFWTSLLLLGVVCGLIVGGFALLQQELYGISPSAWFDELSGEVFALLERQE